MKQGYWAVILLLVLSGCTPDAYKRQADLQVESILRDREQTTLDYKPQVQIKDTVPAEPSKQAYAKIPTTPLVPRQPPPIEPANTELPFGALGPDAPKLPSTNPTTGPTISPDEDAYGIDVAERLAAENLRLGPPNPGRMTTRLDLFASLAYGVQHSRDYQTEMESLYITTLDVTLQRHLFDPIPSAQTSAIVSGGAYSSALKATQSIGVSQKLPWGGDVTAKALASFVNTINSSVNNGEDAELALNTSIPLLRGFGMINLEPLINSERQVVYQIRGFEDFRRQFLVQIATQYFNLLTLQQRLNNRRLNYADLSALTVQTQALYDAGRISFLEVQRARQAQLSAESDLISSQESYQSSLDSFKIRMGMPLETDMDVVPVELDVKVPQIQVQEVVDVATKYRLDLQTARDQIEDARRNVSNAKNGLLPELNFTAGTAVTNHPNSPANHINEHETTYNAGLTLDLPLDRVSERNAYRRGLIQLQRSQRNYENLRESVAIDARDSLRAIRSAELNLKIQQLGIDLALRRLDYSNELLRQGKVTARDVVESQTSLLDAQDAYAQARASLQISILTYLQQTGTLRVDPEAGALGQAMDRAALQMNRLPDQRY